MVDRPQRYDGYLDTNDGWYAYGWAADRERLNDVVEVEFETASGCAGAVTADQFRADLVPHGLGNGKHGFTFRMPLEMKPGDTLTARIRKTNFVLHGSPMPRRERTVVGLVAADIVNNCNLRCPFCMVDYANVRGLKLMTRETFERAIALLPVTAPGNFWLSCLHEPTLHPQFIDFIEAVPDAYRDRVSFTTNLSKRLPQDLLERLANSGIYSIRVSFDSRRPEVFAELRKNARYEIFAQNLLRLTAYLKASKRRPQLHFITMAFKNNYRDIVDLVHYGRGLGSNCHEIRYLYYGPHIAHWGKEHILDAAEWAELEAVVKPLAATGNLPIAGPVQGVREQFEAEQGLAQYIARENAFGGGADETVLTMADPAEIGRQLPDQALQLRMRWDGVMMLEHAEQKLGQFNINNLQRPTEYFEAVRIAALAGAGR